LNIGYARVPTYGQDLKFQIATLKAVGCDPVHIEKRSGKLVSGRPELRRILSVLQRGDTLTVTRVDRLARSIGDLQDIVRKLQGKGVVLRAIEQAIDTSTPAGKMFLGMLGVFAEFDTGVRRERRLEGIAVAKAKGVYIGRPGKIKAADIARLKAEGLGATAIAKTLGISHASVYRVGWSDPVKDRPSMAPDQASKTIVTLAQWRAARALVDLSQIEMAKALGVARRTVQRLEQNPEIVSAEFDRRAKELLQKAGVEFILNGVKLRK
jgi:DNA invertase Pin-like site-specific DNA recombinase